MPHTREGFSRFPLPPLPAMHAKSQPRSRMPVACARQTRTARVKPMPPWPSMVFDFGISNLNHASSNHPSTSQDSISTLHAFRLPSQHPRCHGRARSIKLHPVPCPKPLPTFLPPPWWYHCTHYISRREGKEGRSRNEEPGPWGRHRPSSSETKAALLIFFFATGLHGTATVRHRTNSPCTDILSPSPPTVSSPSHLARCWLCLA
jgi:hypothetical protein